MLRGPSCAERTGASFVGVSLPQQGQYDLMVMGLRDIERQRARCDRSRPAGKSAMLGRNRSLKRLRLNPLHDTLGLNS